MITIEIYERGQCRGTVGPYTVWCCQRIVNADKEDIEVIGPCGVGDRVEYQIEATRTPGRRAIQWGGVVVEREWRLVGDKTTLVVWVEPDLVEDGE